MLCTYIFVLCKHAKVYYAKDYVMDASTTHKLQQILHICGYQYLWISYLTMLLQI